MIFFYILGVIVFAGIVGAIVGTYCDGKLKEMEKKNDGR